MCPKVAATLYLAKWNKDKHPKPQPGEKDKVRNFIKRAFIKKRCGDPQPRQAPRPHLHPPPLCFACPAGSTSLGVLRAPRPQNHQPLQKAPDKIANALPSPVAVAVRVPPPPKGCRTLSLGRR